MISVKSNKIRSIKKLNYNLKIKLRNKLKKYLDWNLKYNF